MFAGANVHNDKLGNPNKIKVFGLRKTDIHHFLFAEQTGKLEFSTSHYTYFEYAIP
jgi:hypothetical protein